MSMKQNSQIKLALALLRIHAVVQFILGLALLALGIAGLVLQSGYAYVAFGVWAGVLASVLASSWSAIASVPKRRSYAMGCMVLVLAAHVACFVLSFFGTSLDFSALLTSLNAISQWPISCATLTMVSSSTMSGRLLVNVLLILVTLPVMLLDIGILFYGHCVYGTRGLFCNEPRDDSDQAVAESSNTTAGQANFKDFSAPAASRASSKANKRGSYRKRLALFWPTVLLLIVLSLASSAVGITNMVAFPMAVKNPPPVWNIVAVILFIVGVRRMKRGAKNWHILMIIAFALSSIGNVVIVALAIVNLNVYWSDVQNMYTSSNALNWCQSPSAANTTVSTSTIASYESNNYSLVWRIVLELSAITLNVFLALLMMGKIIALLHIAKSRRNASGAAGQQNMAYAAGPHRDTNF